MTTDVNQQTAVLGVITPQDVRSKKEQLAVIVMNTNDAVIASQKVANDDKVAWFRWKSIFDSFKTESDSIVTASSSYDKALQLETELANWQTFFSQQGVSIPGQPAKKNTPEPTTKEVVTDVSKTLKTVAIVGGCLIAVMIIMNVYAGTKTIQHILPGGSRNPQEA
mgnify:CR=1 FL=1